MINNIKIFNSHESKLYKFDNKSFFIHCDESNKFSFYIDDNIIKSKGPNNSKTTAWDFKTVNIIRNEMDSLFNSLL